MMKSERVRLHQILVCVCLFCASLCSSADVENVATKIGVDGTALEHMETPVKFRHPETSVSYAVSMTTIPARIPHLRHVVESWLTQRGGPPRYIFIFVPKVYKRFKRKGGAGTGQSFKCMAEGILVDQLESMPGDAAVFKDCPTFLGEEPGLRDNANDNGIFTTIRTIEVDHDWGPATKYVGLMDYRLHWEDKWEVDTREPPDYWVVSDDDVRYLSNTWSLYDAFISNDAIVTEREHEAQGQESRTAPVGPATMLTHFSEDYRQLLHLEQEDFTRPVLHLQGVDTVAFPSRILQMHEEDLCAAAPGWKGASLQPVVGTGAERATLPARTVSGQLLPRRLCHISIGESRQCGCQVHVPCGQE